MKKRGQTKNLAKKVSTKQKNKKVTLKDAPRRSYKKPFLITLIVSLCLSALIGIILFLIGNFGETELRIILTTIVIGIFSLTGLCSASLYERRRFIPLAMGGMILSVISFVFVLALIWGIFNPSLSMLKVVLTLFIISFSIAHISLLLFIIPERNAVKWTLMATVTFITLVALLLILLIVGDFNVDSTLFFRILGVFAILDVLGTIVSPILNKVMK